MADTARGGILAARVRLLELALALGRAIEACKAQEEALALAALAAARLKKPRKPPFEIPFGLLAQILLDPRNVSPFKIPDYNANEEDG